MSSSAMLRNATGLLFSACLLAACPSNDTPSGDAATAASPVTRDGGSAPTGRVVDGDSGVGAPDLTKLNTDYKAWQASTDKLRSCGFLDNGVFTFDPQTDLRCESLCLAAASCADLKTEVCNQLPANSLEDCLDRCPMDAFISCGDGTTASINSVCDLKNDCADGEDEQHCELFVCKAGGSRIAGSSVCDGVPDCDDGSDEMGCALICGKPRVVVFED